MANWSDYGYPDAAALSSPLPAVSGLIGGLNERRIAAALSALSTVPPLSPYDAAWFTAFEAARDATITRYVNHTVNSGDFSGLAAIPMWTVDDLFTFLGEDKLVYAQMHLAPRYPLTWFLQQYRIINLLRWILSFNGDSGGPIVSLVRTEQLHNPDGYFYDRFMGTTFDDLKADLRSGQWVADQFPIAHEQFIYGYDYYNGYKYFCSVVRRSIYKIPAYQCASSFVVYGKLLPLPDDSRCLGYKNMTNCTDPDAFNLIYGSDEYTEDINEYSLFPDSDYTLENDPIPPSGEFSYYWFDTYMGFIRFINKFTGANGFAFRDWA